MLLGIALPLALLPARCSSSPSLTGLCALGLLGVQDPTQAVTDEGQATPPPSPKVEEPLVKLEGAELLAAIKKQVDFYFSKSNLESDSFLVSKMDTQMMVPIAVIAQFAKVWQRVLARVRACVRPRWARARVTCAAGNASSTAARRCFAPTQNLRKTAEFYHFLLTLILFPRHCTRPPSLRRRSRPCPRTWL